MAEPILWATLTIAATSLIFAGIAYRQVMKSTKEVGRFLDRANKFLDSVPGTIKKLITPKFMAETLERAVTSGLENEDGSPVTMPQYIAGWANAVGPRIYADLKKEIPSYIPLLLNPSPPITSPGAPQTRQPNGQFGSGGLKAATNLAKAAKKLPMAGKVVEVIETGQALVGMIGPIKEIIGEVRGLKGGGGNGEESGSTPSSSSDGAMTDWGPPF